MKNIKVKNYQGKEYEGTWNEKFYSSQLEEHKDYYRIYINNERLHLTEDQKEELLKSISDNKIDEDNKRTEIIKEEYSKLSEEAKQELIKYLVLKDADRNTMKEIRREKIYD